MPVDRLDDVDRDASTSHGATHPVLRKGSGPGVVVISEVPDITPPVADFSRRVVDDGFTVAMPGLFGHAGRPTSLPFSLTPTHARDLGISDADLQTVRRRCEDEDLCILGLRFRGDALSPGVRFERLEREFGDHVVGIQLDPSSANPAHRPIPPHSVVTADLVDEPGEPTHEARERVLQLSRDRPKVAA